MTNYTRLLVLLFALFFFLKMEILFLNAEIVAICSFLILLTTIVKKFSSTISEVFENYAKEISEAYTKKFAEEQNWYTSEIANKEQNALSYQTIDIFIHEQELQSVADSLVYNIHDATKKRIKGAC